MKNFNVICLLIGFENMKPVYEGKQHMINFYSGLEWVTKVKFTTPRGDPLLNVVTKPIFGNNLPGN